jgi:Pyridoxamine 5'-phosphate oxidase
LGKTYAEITPAIRTWIGRQAVYFVATAPLSGGHVNCSPKGLDSFRVLDGRTVCYLDLLGSGAETASHVRENGRIVFMFCAFEGPPKIIRLHGRAEVVLPGSADWAELDPLFPARRAKRSVIRAKIDRVSDSCGFGVPLMALAGERGAMEKWCEGKSDGDFDDYRRKKNAKSIDGLAGFDG